MNIETEILPHVVVLTLSGKLDPIPAEALQAEIDTHLNKGVRSFVFDLTNLEYIGSFGLRVFIVAAKKVPGGVRLAGLQPMVRNVFDITQVSTLLKIYPTRRDALDAAGS